MRTHGEGPAIRSPAVSRVPRLVPPVHLDALDGLRGCAILLVLLYHARLSGGIYSASLGHALAPFLLGWTGVDLFFVLSGFLITRNLLATRGADNFLRSFYTRRALRIFPAYFAAIAVYAVAASIWDAQVLQSQPGMGWLLTFTSNVPSLWGVDSNSFGPLTHFWSLAVEEHFYLFWPFAVMLASQKRLIQVTAAIFVVALVSRTLWTIADDAATLYPTALTAGSVFTLFRADSLAAGAFLAAVAAGPQGLSRLKPWAAMLMLPSLAVVGWIVLHDNTGPNNFGMKTIGFSVLAVFFACVLVLALTSVRVQGLLSARPLRFIGRHSFGLYVWHFGCYLVFFHSDWAARTFGHLGLFGALAMLAMASASTIVLTWLSWRFIEQPFLALKPRFAARAGREPLPQGRRVPAPAHRGESSLLALLPESPR
jgi:peptidoglycan/LPS O-acetylase OafA/YrhL